MDRAGGRLLAPLVLRIPRLPLKGPTAKRTPTRAAIAWFLKRCCGGISRLWLCSYTHSKLVSYASSSTGQYAITTASARFGERVPSGCLSMISFMRVFLLMVG